jgi:hypothetical protein
VIETSYMALTAQALQSVQVWLKSVSTEGHFTREAETVFRSYHTSHCSGETGTSHVALNAHALQSVQVWLKSVSNEGHFTREAERVSRPYLASNCSGVTEA